MKSARQIYADLRVETSLQKRKKRKIVLCDFFNILSGPLLVGHGDMTVHYGFSEECGRKQLFFLFELGDVYSNLLPSHVWERQFVKVQ